MHPKELKQLMIFNLEKMVTNETAIIQTSILLKTFLKLDDKDIIIYEDLIVSVMNYTEKVLSLTMEWMKEFTDLTEKFKIENPEIIKKVYENIDKSILN